MPEIFDIAGEIVLESGAFAGSVRAAEARLKGLDSALDSTISKSNKLGDTSATVARRYEKLAEGIKAQKDRLLDNALAFEKGEISAKQFSTVVVSVDKATTSLSGKLKDAKARLTELNETGLTHFQQQVAGAVDNANNKLESFRQQILQTQRAASPQSTDLLKNLFGNLSGFQKTQLSFQLNDILTGLASGQSPMQILAQQGGQVVQILQQGKPAAEGIAAATATAAVSETAFATAAKGAAVSQAQVAVSSEATAAAMTQASASATILGASAVSLGAILVAGLTTILAVYKAVKDIENTAKKRLETETAITAEWNKQSELINNLNKKLKEQAAERFFNAQLDASPTLLTDLQKERDAIAREIETERAKRNAVLTAVPQTNKEFASKFLADAASPQQRERLAQLDEQILKTTAHYADLRQAQKDAYRTDVIEGAMRNAAASRKFAEEAAVAQAKAEQELADKRKKLVDESIKKAKEWAEHVKAANAEIISIVSGTSENPYVKIFLAGEQAVQKMLEATKGLGAELQNNLRKLIESDTATKAFKQSMENSLKASGLRSEAAQFLGRAKPTVSENLQNQLNAIGGGSPFLRGKDFAIGANGALTEIARTADPNQRARDQRIIELTKGLEQSGDITPAQKQAAAAARLREAAALEKEKPDAQKELKDTLKLINQAIRTGHLVTVKDETQNGITVTGDAKTTANKF